MTIDGWYTIKSNQTKTYFHSVIIQLHLLYCQRDNVFKFSTTSGKKRQTMFLLWIFTVA